MAMTMEQWRAKYGSHGVLLVVEAVEESCINGSLPPEGIIDALVKMTKELSEAMMQARPPDDLSEALCEVWSAMPEHQDGRPITLVAEGTDHWTASIVVGSAHETHQMGSAADAKTALIHLAHQVRVYREEQGC